MKNNIIMWTEPSATQRQRLKDALALATQPIQQAMEWFEWEDEHLTCGPDTLKDGKEHWRNLYFYLSGYGDSQFLNGGIHMQPAAIPIAPTECRCRRCHRTADELPSGHLERVNPTGELPAIWECCPSCER